MKQVILYIHGKGGNAAEAKHYKPLFMGSDVIGFDYKAETPWEAKTEFAEKYEELEKQYDSIVLVANSIGAYFSMHSLSDKKIERAYFISPVANMEQLICDMMQWAGVTEEKLKAQKEIPTSFGEVLSWDYLCYVREHPVNWNVFTEVLYGEKDALISRSIVDEFASNHPARLTVMHDGEHWFHTDKQMLFLDNWIKNSLAIGDATNENNTSQQ